MTPLAPESEAGERMSSVSLPPTSLSPGFFVFWPVAKSKKAIAGCDLGYPLELKK